MEPMLGVASEMVSAVGYRHENHRVLNPLTLLVSVEQQHLEMVRAIAVAVKDHLDRSIPVRHYGSSVGWKFWVV